MQQENKVIVEGAIITKRPWFWELAAALGSQRFKPDFTQLALDTGKPVTTIYDAWAGLVQDNQVEVVITIRGKGTDEVKP